MRNRKQSHMRKSKGQPLSREYRFAVLIADGIRDEDHHEIRKEFVWFLPEVWIQYGSEPWGARIASALLEWEGEVVFAKVTTEHDLIGLTPAVIGRMVIVDSAISRVDIEGIGLGPGNSDPRIGAIEEVRS